MTDEPVCLFNALWFSPDGGVDRYAEYGTAVQPILEDVGGSILLPPLTGVTAVEGGFDPDLVVCVRYPNEGAFDAMWQSDRYREIAHLRTDATTKTVLTKCEIEPSDAAAVEDLDGGAAVINALWFNKGGDATYGRYLDAAAPIVSRHGGRFVMPRLRPFEAVDGDFVPDLLFLGVYPDADGLNGVVSDGDYASAAEHRTEALARSATSIVDLAA